MLLKNDGTLPLKKGKSQTRCGRTACGSDEISALVTMPALLALSVSARRPEGGVSRSGDQLRSGDSVPAQRWRSGSSLGFYHRGWEAGPDSGIRHGRVVWWGKPTVLATAHVTTIDLKAEDIPSKAAGKYPFRVEWTGFSRLRRPANSASACASKAVP